MTGSRGGPLSCDQHRQDALGRRHRPEPVSSSSPMPGDLAARSIPHWAEHGELAAADRARAPLDRLPGPAWSDHRGRPAGGTHAAAAASTCPRPVTRATTRCCSTATSTSSRRWAAGAKGLGPWTPVLRDGTSLRPRRGRRRLLRLRRDRRDRGRARGGRLARPLRRAAGDRRGVGSARTCPRTWSTCRRPARRRVAGRLPGLGRLRLRPHVADHVAARAGAGHGHRAGAGRRPALGHGERHRAAARSGSRGSCWTGSRTPRPARSSCRRCTSRSRPDRLAEVREAVEAAPGALRACGAAGRRPAADVRRRGRAGAQLRLAADPVGHRRRRACRCRTTRATCCGRSRRWCCSFRLPPTADAAVGTGGGEARADHRRALRRDGRALAASSPPTAGTPRTLAPWLSAALDDAGKDVFGAPWRTVSLGGSIPFMGLLHEAYPDAQFVVTGRDRAGQQLPRAGRVAAPGARALGSPRPWRWSSTRTPGRPDPALSERKTQTTPGPHQAV